MTRKFFSCLSLVAVLLLGAACDTGKAGLVVDATQPVGKANRVIYQMNIGAFTPEGTFSAARDRLAYLDTLGADILWLMPIYPRGTMMNSPYASMDFRGVNPAYGTVADVKDFVRRAHELGMKVWLDWVPNHVANEHPWVTTHPQFLSTDEQGRMIHPFGWMDVLQLNYQDQGLVDEMNATMKFWVSEVGVDGFRCDYVSSPTIPVAYWQHIIAELKDMGCELLSETDISDPNNRRIDDCGFDYDYAWNFQERLVKRFGAQGTSADSLKALCEQFLAESWTVSNLRMVYLTNHDQNYNDGGHTLADFYGSNRYALTVLEFTLYGMPLLYQGQEIGDPDTLNYFTDAKVKWDRVDPRMRHTVRTLIALHHHEPDLAENAPIAFMQAEQDGQPSHGVLAYQRGAVLVLLNLADQQATVRLPQLAAGKYDQWLDSRTIADGPCSAVHQLDANHSFSLDAKGYAVYVKH